MAIIVEQSNRLFIGIVTLTTDNSWTLPLYNRVPISFINETISFFKTLFSEKLNITPSQALDEFPPFY